MTRDFDRWARCPGCVPRSPWLVKSAHKAWTHQVPTITSLVRAKAPPARVLSIGCYIGRQS